MQSHQFMSLPGIIRRSSVSYRCFSTRESGATCTFVSAVASDSVSRSRPDRFSFLGCAFKQALFGISRHVALTEVSRFFGTFGCGRGDLARSMQSHQFMGLPRVTRRNSVSYRCFSTRESGTICAFASAVASDCVSRSRPDRFSFHGRAFKQALFGISRHVALTEVSRLFGSCLVTFNASPVLPTPVDPRMKTGW